MTSKYQDIEDLIVEFKAKKALLEKKINPLREKIDASSKSNKVDKKALAKVREELKSYMPEMYKLDNQIGAMTRAVGARHLSTTQSR